MEGGIAREGAAVRKQGASQQHSITRPTVRVYQRFVSAMFPICSVFRRLTDSVKVNCRGNNGSRSDLDYFFSGAMWVCLEFRPGINRGFYLPVRPPTPRFRGTYGLMASLSVATISPVVSGRVGWRGCDVGKRAERCSENGPNGPVWLHFLQK